MGLAHWALCMYTTLTSFSSEAQFVDEWESIRGGHSLSFLKCAVRYECRIHASDVSKDVQVSNCFSWAIILSINGTNLCVSGC